MTSNFDAVSANTLNIQNAIDTAQSTNAYYCDLTFQWTGEASILLKSSSRHWFQQNQIFMHNDGSSYYPNIDALFAVGDKTI